jgi:hypothetical protein
MTTQPRENYLVGGVMCFSAAGSFAVAGVLSGVGAVSLRRNTMRTYVMVAAIPLIFAVQQAAEGVVWLTIPHASSAEIQRVAVITFLGCALIVWPVWLSFSLRRVERIPERRRILGVLCWAGVIVASIAFLLLARERPSVSIAGHSIHYERVGGGGNGARNAFLILAYAVPTIAPFFVSTMRLAGTIGVALIVSLIVTAVVERDALTSVWCFFAALLSVLIVIGIDAEQKLARA